MKLEIAQIIAEKIKKQLEPHCFRIEIAGSVRRKSKEVKDIEIVAMPKPYDIGLFESGIATIVNKWQKVKGELPCKYTQRNLPEGIKLDLFFADHDNWGYILAIRTGSARYSHEVLARTWTRKGYTGNGGYLYHEDRLVKVPEERGLFDLLELEWKEPELRH